MSETDVVAAALAELEASFARLREAIEGADNQEVVWLRFKMTREALWKAIREFLIFYRGYRCRKPRSCIKQGMMRDLLVEGEVLLDILADEVVARVGERYVGAIEANIQRLRECLAGWGGRCWHGMEEVRG